MPDPNSYYDSQEFRDILKKYEQALSEGTFIYMDADELTDIAEYYMTRGQENCANKAIQMAVALHPDSQDPKIFLARQKMFHGQLDEALHMCDNLPDQSDNEAKFLRMELYIRNDDIDSAIDYAIEAYSQLAEGRPGFLLDCAYIFIDYNLPDKALELADMLRKCHPSYPPAQNLLADVYMALGNYREAILILNGLLDATPYDTELWNILAEAQRGMEAYSEAVESTEFVLAMDPLNKKATITKAQCLFHQNLFEQAHFTYRQYLSQHPDDDNVMYLDGVCLANMERFSEAAEILRKASHGEERDETELMHILLQLAYVESKLHNLEPALEALNHAKEMSTEDTMLEYNLLVGEILLENDLKDSAEDHFRLAVNESRDKQSTLLSIAITYAENRYYDEAIPILHRIMELGCPESGQQAIPYLAYCYYHTRQTDLFLHFLRQSVNVSRETTEFLFARFFPNVQPEEYYVYALKMLGRGNE